MEVLVVDDDALSGEMVAAVLEAQGHQPVLADNAVDGMAQLNAHPQIGLIISDMNMPLISGIEFFRELREQGNTLPFILLTGDDPEAARQQESGLSACLVKDFTLDESLPRIMRGVLDGQ
ncbi:response regulator [Vreelandella massiliensis]|uniref:response regulator n=1 Tax=Vreelandella massiliensis TaxID=1816686 RepID=UPI00096AA2DC|nr:response regulator [Halomonas massiliensis]MYL24444.1 response regulator [Halomonas alkaliantarctica]